MTQPLTPRQRTLLEEICSHQYQNCRMPTVRELSAAMGIASLNGITCHLIALEKKGWLRHTSAATSRSWTILAAPPGWVLLPGGGIVPRKDLAQLIEDLQQKFLAGLRVISGAASKPELVEV